MTQSANSEPFAQALHSGNLQRAGDWIVRSFASEVFGLCLAIVRDHTTAEDLSQEIFAKAFANLAGFREESSVRTWLLAIARNRCIDHLRAQQRSAIVDTTQDPEEFAEETALPPSILSRRTEIEQALGDLTEMERGLIVLRFRNGLAYEELAQAFGVKPGTVRMRVSRALSKMRGALEPAPLLSRSASKVGMPAPGAAPAPTRRRASLRPSSPAIAQAPPSRSAPPPPPPQAPSGLSRPPMARSAKAQPHVLSEFFSQDERALPQQLSAKLSSMAQSLPSRA